MGIDQILSPGELAEIPPSIRNNLPALQPPAGVESNFITPEDRGYIQITVSTVLFCFMVILFANRVYTKLSVIRKVRWDDLTCTIGFLGSTAVYIAFLRSTSPGPVGKHQWDVRLVDLLSENFLITSAITVFVTPPSLLFTKLTFFLFYFQIFWPLRWLRVSVYIGATLTCIFYGAATIAQIAFEAPSPGETWLEVALSKRFTKTEILAVPFGAVGLVIDIVLLILPLVAVASLHLPPKRKIGVMFIFMFGIFACVGSLLSIYYRVLNDRSRDLTWSIMPVDTVGAVELFIGVSCACMPAFSKMIRHHLPAIEKFRTVLSSAFASLLTSKSGGATGHSGLSQSDDPNRYAEGNPTWGSYHPLEVEMRSPGGAPPQPTYELGQLQSVQTIIGKGWDKRTSDDRIHLTHEIQQQRTRAH